MIPNEEFLRLPAVEKIVGFKKSKIWELVKVHKFPEPIRLNGANISVWLKSEVLRWMQEQIVLSREFQN